jgi:hypothetical protein
VLLVAHLAGLLAFLLPAVPLLLLVASLLWGVYPGCDAMARLAERIAAGRRRRSSAGGPLPTRPWSFSASGGLLIAMARAERPPPVVP